MIIRDIIKGIVICRESGEYLIDLIYDKNINPLLLSSFVSALSLFGEDRLGKITNISISGLDVNMIITYKYKLILIAILSKGYATYGVRSQLEKALEMFYSTYYQEMLSNYCISLEEFSNFKNILFIELWKYLKEINKLRKSEKDSKEYKIISADEDMKEQIIDQTLTLIDFSEVRIDDSFISRYIKGIFICDQSGNYLVDLVFDTGINFHLLSSFVGTLNLFGEETMKQFEEINIMGINVDMMMISKYNLILIMFADKSFPKPDLAREAELALDMFFSSFQEEIKTKADKSAYFKFKNLLYWQIVDYFKKIKDLKEKKEISELPDYGILTEAIFKKKKEQK